MGDNCINDNGNMLNQTRPLEYMLGFLAIAYGVHILVSNAVFDMLAYKIMSELMPVTRWGMTAVFIGVVRVAAVAINGRVFYTPLIRCAMAIIAGCFWLALVVMMIASANLFGAKLPAGVAYYPIFILFEGWCVISSAYDMKKNLLLRTATLRMNSRAPARG